ncbi:HD domain-containing protein [Clostridium celatum]|uniref:HD domain protein n=1 Tax=Clostridium celatum DSM 1785 TaxID=545697 RepID=L1QLU9_9CLOT|nr:HD domain-containing protein [Clostridium celatum]EKY28906.1 HD domain protein [Clostridium celatum DSM 1785]MCE9655049.1 HD domain-containing protein [Clostridium celatum]MDU2266464.1 HD domain-containing protein [Clostridium celatum]MDU6296776.1 HD domain-containing protein [Clostridium celatum]MDY3362075.1 HD domain-containing protein [Clostridium celatum]
MDKDLIIEKTKEFVKNKLYGEGSGHDWFHIERVYNLSRFLANEEKADNFIVEMTALLHDIDDWKFSNGTKTNTTITEEFLNSVNVDKESINKIITIIKTMSFKGGVVNSTQNTIEGMIVQDADRLDAIGAIGIARTFAYGGSKNRPIYDPNIAPINFTSLEEVKNAENHTINHFYEKLLKLKDLMNTDSAKIIAEKRHKFMENFLKEFYSEWNFNY